MPKELPPNTEIIYISEGGFAPSFFSIAISGGKMKVTDRPTGNAEKETVWETKLNDDELKNLYGIFVENKFDLIRPNEPSEVADGKSRSIELKFGGKQFYAVIGDGIKTTQNHAERFRNIENAIESLVKNYGK